MRDKNDSPIMFADSIPKAWVDAQYSLMPREVESLDRIVYNVVRHRRIATKYFPTVPIPKGKRYRTLAISQEMREPIFDDDFMTEDIDEAKKSEHTFWLGAMHKDFRLKMIDIDASRNNRYYNISHEQLNIREAVKTIVDYKERFLWLGYASLNKARTGAHPQGSIDTNVEGIFNCSNGDGTLNTFTAGAGANDGIDAAGDGPITVGKAMASLIVDQYYGPYVFIMTPDCYAQLAQNFNSTTHISDIERMRGMIDLNGNKILENLDVTHYLIAAAATADNGAMLCMQRKTPEGEPTAIIMEAYPVSHYPTQMTSLGIKGKVLWMGNGSVLRMAAFTEETAVNIVT